MSLMPLIAGVGMTPFGRFPDRSLADLAGESALAALADAGVDASEIDVVFAANSGAGLLTGQESIRGQVSLKAAGFGGMPIFNVENACASGSSAVHLAVQYLRAGAAQCVLVVGYEKMAVADRSLPLRALEACSDVQELAELKQRLGPDAQKRSIFMDYYADKVRAYFAQGGGEARHLAGIAAKNHSNGALNPRAQFRAEQTTESVLASRAIVEPLTLLMCSPISDGAAALVLATPEWARTRAKTGPRIAASAMATDSFATDGSQMAALARRAYEQAGIRPADIDVAEVHDATAAGELFAYEDLLLAAPGQGWRLVEEGHVRLGGRTPVNPSGGLLARGHPVGATGVAQVCELAWQLRGQAQERQVAHAKTAVAHCLGGQSSFGRTSGAAAMCITVLQS
ncbi:MAG TPA: thiolase family protein [Ramlibacter sp.]|nr:thiolase family protein [Ramlibacter sp.]